MTWERHGGGTLPHGEGLRRAVRWLGEQGRHDLAALEEAAVRFDLDPQEEAFLIAHFHTAAAEPPPPE
jgi:hypothetical protein